MVHEYLKIPRIGVTLFQGEIDERNLRIVSSKTAVNSIHHQPEQVEGLVNGLLTGLQSMSVEEMNQIAVLQEYKGSCYETSVVYSLLNHPLVIERHKSDTASWFDTIWARVLRLCSKPQMRFPQKLNTFLNHEKLVRRVNIKQEISLLGGNRTLIEAYPHSG